MKITAHVMALSTILLGASFPCSARAQHALFISQGKQWRPVYSVTRTVPNLMINGKLEPVGEGGTCTLQPAETYPPVIVGVENLSAKFLNMRPDSANKMLKGFTFRAGFKPTAAIDGVYLYLVVAAKSGLQQTFFHEIGDLEPNKPKFLSFDHDLAQDWEFAGYRFMLFARGAELLQSAMPETAIDKALAKMVSQQLEGVTTSGPKPLIAPPPPYPEALRAKKLEGRAIVAFSISAQGRVTEPKLVEANDPAFGDAALTTLANWRFVPAMRDGKRIATSARLPFNFTP